MKSIALGLALAFVAAGCGVQIAGGPAVHSRVQGSMDIGARLTGTRKSGAYAGTDFVLAEPHGHTFSVRHGIATGGYRLIMPHFSLELGADLGAGEPASVAWQGTGFYLGLSPTLLFRVYGNQDTALGYSVASVLVDVVCTLRGGVWSRPAGDSRRELAEAALLVGFRGSLISDVPVSTNQNWDP